VGGYSGGRAAATRKVVKTISQRCGQEIAAIEEEVNRAPRWHDISTTSPNIV
jgi:hypothetical protein